jgi:hypothetical protein
MLSCPLSEAVTRTPMTSLANVLFGFVCRFLDLAYEVGSDE